MKALLISLGVAVASLGGSAAQAMVQPPFKALVMELRTKNQMILIKGKVGKPKVGRTTKPTFQRPATPRAGKKGSKIIGPGRIRIPRPWPPKPPEKRPTKPGDGDKKRKGNDKPTRPFQPPGPKFTPGGI